MIGIRNFATSLSILFFFISPADITHASPLNSFGDGVWTEVQAKTPFRLAPETRGSYAIAEIPGGNAYYVFAGLRENLETEIDPQSGSAAAHIKGMNDLWKLSLDANDEFIWQEVIPRASGPLPDLTGNIQGVYATLFIEGELRNGLFVFGGGPFPSTIFNGGFTLDAVLGVRFDSFAWFFDEDAVQWFKVNLSPVGFSQLPKAFGYNVFLDPDTGDIMLFGGIFLKALLDPNDLNLPAGLTLDDFGNVVGFNTLYRVDRNTLDVTIDSSGTWTQWLQSSSDPTAVPPDPDNPPDDVISIDPVHTGSFIPYSGDDLIKYVLVAGSDPNFESGQESPSSGSVSVVVDVGGKLFIQLIAPNLTFDPPPSSVRGMSFDQKKNIMLLYGGESPAPANAPSCSAGEPENPTNLTRIFQVKRSGPNYSVAIRDLNPDHVLPSGFATTIFQTMGSEVDLKARKRHAMLRFVDSQGEVLGVTFGGYNFEIPFDDPDKKIGCQEEFGPNGYMRNLAVFKEQ